MSAESAQARRAIVFVPFPAQGHVTPMLHLARALADRGGVAATLAVPDFVHRRMMSQDGGDNDNAAGRVALVPIPSGVPDDGGDEPPGFASIVHAMEHHMPAHLEGLLLAMARAAGRGGAAACLVVDVLASWAVPVAARCGVPAVGFWPVMFASYRVVAAIPELISNGFISGTGTPLPPSTNKINEADSKGRKLGDLDILPSKLELSTADLPWLVGGAASRQSRFAFWLQTVDRAKSLDCILVNSFPGEGAGDADRPYDPPPGQRILHVGPLFDDDSLGRPPCRKSTAAAGAAMWQADPTCMEWLDRQSPGSVVYVSFGSWVAPIGPDKIAQFALGLEAAGRPFLWVLKSHPSWRAGLPDQFAETIAAAGRGKIVSWAPQEDVLRHGAVGCFVTHCGTNSALEAIRHGVRMICYPISGDQFINSAYIVNMWGAGIALASSDRDCVKDCIESVMEGEEGRRLQENVARMREMVMLGEGRSIAKRNLDLFLEGIIKSDDDAS
ncbi:unnamed protein product [Urochloa decumbens]|uniref:Glycosyltransferase n=1 Tax=Urochloa decumbens TaxID=240449 RepID=A0ABC8V9Q4_9POAL